MNFCGCSPDQSRSLLYAGVVVLILVLFYYFFVAASAELATDGYADYSGVPIQVETPMGTGYVAAALPYGGLGGPNIRFNELTSTDQQPYAAGYIERFPWNPGYAPY